MPKFYPRFKCYKIQNGDSADFRYFMFAVCPKVSFIDLTCIHALELNQ